MNHEYQPLDYVTSDERLSEKPQDRIVCACLFAIAGIAVGFTACFIWLTK